MKEYKESKWLRAIFVCMSLPLCVFFLWAIFNGETLAVTLGSIAMFLLFLYTLINPFVHTLILDENHIAEKTLLGRKQIFFKDVTHINIDSLFAEVISGKKKIQIGKLMENSDHIIGYVVSKIKDNENLLFAGYPILLQSYVNDFSENKSLTEYNEFNLSNFTFVENAELVEKKWLFRVIDLKTSKGNFKITYFGKGMGYECVFVNDELISKKDSSLWYIPNFNFNYQGINFSVNIRVYPWMTIRKFWIEVDNKIVYSE